VRLEQSLVLNRYFHSLLGARGLEDLKPLLARTEEGAAADGQSRFFHALAGPHGLRLPEDRLREYDARIVGYEARLARGRERFALKYFQYLALLYTEIFLDRLTENPEALLRDLNGFLDALRREEPTLRDFPGFAADDLRWLAFFMATGSGKTLLLHANLWQVLHYLERGRHPEALVHRPDGRREFESIILITPNEGLSQQHLSEFHRSGIDVVHLVQDRGGRGLLGPRVRVVEIHKLAEQPSREGVSVLLEELGSANLIFVDEGHKGTGSEARTWKSRQRTLSRDGFLLEYSATFAQSIGAAGRKAQEALLAEYGKAILFDYSYRHFYDDGYGKDFHVLNLARARESRAHDLLLGGLLTYYQQVRLFRDNGAAYRPYNLEPPLWIFLGSSVNQNAVYTRGGRKRSDVATVVAFLRRFLEEPAWATDGIRKILKGESGFTDRNSKDDLFAPRLTSLRGAKAESLYRQIADEVFHGRGGLEVWELKNADGELALRVSAPEGRENPYFGVINIGDVSAFKKYLAEHNSIEVREDRFTPSLFGAINTPGSRVQILVGAKKFIEGWSSWRVSTMGLLNVGKGEGPQVIQLFGRGVRLKGKQWTLKRSAALPEEAPHPEGLHHLETLVIFGWNADYIQAFRGMLEQEDLGREITVPVKALFDEDQVLPVPRPQAGYRVESETWTLAAEGFHVSVDLTPRVTVLSGATPGGAGEAGRRSRVDFSDPAVLGLLDLDALRADLIEYKATRGCGNVLIPRGALRPVLEESALYMSEDDLGDPRLVQADALRVLKTYLDRFVARKEREAESRHVEPVTFAVRERVVPYTVRVPEVLLKEIETLLRKPTELYHDGGKPLPRLHIERHLFSPLLLNPADHGLKDVTVSPPGLGEGEAGLLRDLRDFWRARHGEPRFRNLEVFLLRNLPRVGVGFFRRSGFYPDFILWIRDNSTGAVRVRFLEPHGMRLSGGLAGNQEKIDALKDLATLSEAPAFRERNLTMDGFLLTRTALDDIPDARKKTLEELERDFRLMPQRGNYVERLLR
jgi:hypothetical protein